MPSWFYGYFLLAASHLEAGREAEAQAVITRCREILPDAALPLLDRFPLADRARMDRLRQSLRQAGLPD